MNELWAIFYGIVQGITEFLPISSSGHLALIPKFFPLKDPGVIFDLVMHLGTAVAVILYFRKDVLKLIQEMILLVKTRDFKNEGIFFQNFTFATIISVISILIIKDFALAYGRSSTFIAINLIVFGILMWVGDRTESSNIDLVTKKDFKRSFMIGFSQSLAIFPGVSRSGITLTAARFSKLSRIDASKFSFLLSLPIILASIAYKAPKIFSGEAISVDVSVILLGTFVSFIVGILSIHFFLKVIANMGLWVFSLYRVVLGIIIIAFL
jgi:undecaprenyl-diphosphatase